MNIVKRKEQIIRIQSQSAYPALQEALQEKLNAEVIGVTQSVIETAL
jgi:hypothetical protein